MATDEKDEQRLRDLFHALHPSVDWVMLSEATRELMRCSYSLGKTTTLKNLLADDKAIEAIKNYFYPTGGSIDYSECEFNCRDNSREALERAIKAHTEGKV